MGIVLGIDIGSSATKIVAMDESKTILNSLKKFENCVIILSV